MKAIHIAGAMCAFIAGQASAQLVASASLERAAIGAGESAKVTVQFDVISGTNCGIRVHWGDGSSTDFKINQAKDVPLVATRPYPQAGSFALSVEPKSQGMTPKCGGKSQNLALTVGPAGAGTRTAPVGAASPAVPSQPPAPVVTAPVAAPAAPQRVISPPVAPPAPAAAKVTNTAPQSPTNAAPAGAGVRKP